MLLIQQLGTKSSGNLESHTLDMNWSIPKIYVNISVLKRIIHLPTNSFNEEKSIFYQILLPGCPIQGFYGESCSIPCPRNCQEGHCHILKGTCLGCDDGLTGPTCETSKWYRYWHDANKYLLRWLIFNLKVCIFLVSKKF